MPQSKESKISYDYNIYKIDKDKINELKQHLLDRSFNKIDIKKGCIKNSGGFNFEILFCDKISSTGMPWIDLISNFTDQNLELNIRTYGAAIICQKDGECYAISYGNAHFYINEFANPTFGINVAERIIDLENVKTQQNISQGSRKNKVLTDYFSGTQLSFRGGEIPTFIRGESINESIWGKIISCGKSTQFRWELLPLEIGQRLNDLTKVLKKEVKNEIPKLIILDSEQQIKELNLQLAKAIKEYDEKEQNNSYINVPYFYFVGTKLIQSEGIAFKISCDRKTGLYEGEVTIEKIQEFLQEKNIDIEKSLLNIKIAIQNSEGKFNYHPLLEYLEFITNDNICLREGKWCTFNQSYLNQVLRDVRQIEILNHNGDKEYIYHKGELEKYARQKNIYPQNNENKVQYETFYNNRLNEIINGKMIHPETIPVEKDGNGRYKYEICDIVKGTDMYFVKIGKPHDFAYAVDQAMQTLELIQKGYGKISLPDASEIIPKKFHLLLVFSDRKNIVKKWEDIYSINFLVHLAELKQKVNVMGIDLIVEFAYNF
ncbi:MAG: TIGR04141 family sporadically distributed protein [Bacilli bacterium]|jgi:uncharacterized protein (TIGR04141 family)|nr:TIGR04141 family sporadically distributed protein [Bacilli bacterium]